MKPIYVIQTSFSSLQDARRLAGEALASRLAACVQILGPGQSMYRWQGAIDESEEFYLSFKTSSAKGSELMDWLIKQHPYDVPEIICKECSASAEYADWLQAETK